MSRRLAREVALRTLFQIEVGHSELQFALNYNAAELGTGEEAKQFAAQICHGVLQHMQFLDKTVESFAVDWRVDRMPYIDRNILRMAAFELLYSPDKVPAGVAVNEAVELAKQYGDENSSRFINGVLGNLVRNKVEVIPPEGQT